MALDLLQVSYLVKGIVLATAVVLLCGGRPKPAPVCLVALVAVLLLASLLWRLFPELGLDYHFFWEVGRDVWAGRDPYVADRFARHPFLNPPTALPLFALCALGPFEVSFLVWTVVNILGCLILLPLAQSTLAAQEQAAGQDQGGSLCWTLTPLLLVGLTPALLVSDASLVGLYLGQLGLLAAVALLAALHAQARHRP